MLVWFTTDAKNMELGFRATYYNGPYVPCSTGEYNRNGTCKACSNKPDYSRYTSNGGASWDGCSWECDSGYKVSNGSCYQTTPCKIGEYRGSQLGPCSPCTNIPNNSYYTSNGTNSTGCSWICIKGYKWNGVSCSYPLSGDGWRIGGAAPGIAGGLGGLLLAILILTVILRAKDAPDSASAGTKPQNSGCACTATFSARRASQAACCALAALTLAAAVASDSLPCNPSDPVPKLGLAVAALGLQSIGGGIMYCLSSCGCRLCCACAPGVCGRPTQATATIGCSIFLWLFAIGLLIIIALFLFVELSMQRLGYRYGEYTQINVFEAPCFYTHSQVPSGLTSIAGLLSAASLVLNGHFITIVPEALHSRYPPPPGDAAAAAAAAPPTHAQPQSVAGTEALLPRDQSGAQAAPAWPGPHPGSISEPELVVRVLEVAPPPVPPAAPAGHGPWEGQAGGC
jgi:hypothetical protein